MCKSQIRFVVWALTLAAVASLTFVERAGAFMGMYEGLSSEKLAHMRFELELTDEQMDELQDIFLASAKKLIPKRGELKLARLEMGAMMSDPEPDRKKIEAHVRNVGALQTEVRLLQMMRRLDVLAVLTPEQRKMLQMRFAPGRGRKHSEMGRGMRERMGRARGMMRGERGPKWMHEERLEED